MREEPIVDGRSEREGKVPKQGAAPLEAPVGTGAVSATESPGGGLARLRGNPWLTLLVVGVGVMMVALDGTIVAIANPAIQADLKASLPEIQWITNGYLLALAVVLITAGKLGDRFGHRTTFLVGAVGFAASSAAIGLSGSITGVIVFRVLQGVFGALLMPAALGLLRAAFPPERLNAAIGIWGGVIGASTAAGPIVGGLLVEHSQWESVFYINVPVGIAALLLGLWILPTGRAERAPGSFDVPGVVLLSGAMFLLVWGLIKADEYGWGSLRMWLFVGGSVVVGAAFAFWETRAREPLVPLALFRSVPLSAGVVLMVLMAFAFMGGLFFVTFYLQNVHGYSPVDSGVRLLPLTGMMIVGSPVAGLLIGRLGPRVPIVVGMVLVAVAMFGMSQLDTESGGAEMSLWFLLMGLGLSPVMVGATDVIVGNAPIELSGVAGGLQQSAMQVGGTLGTAVLGALMGSRVSERYPELLAEAKVPQALEAAGAPPMTEAQAAQAEEAVKVGMAPVGKGMPEQIAAGITDAAQGAFTSGMGLAFTVAGVVAVGAAVLGLLVRRGSGDAGPSVHI